MPYSSAQINPYPVAKILNTPHNETFTNYNLVEVTVRFLEVDSEDPINSSISLEHRIKERLTDYYNLTIEDIKILKTVTYQKTHFINTFYNRFFLQKIENEDGSYKYISNDLRNESNKIIVEVPFETIDGKDYYIGDGFRCEIQEIPQDYFKNIDEKGCDVEYVRTIKRISPEDLI
ncbi:MAG TPA: hypothetical protein PLH46_06350 [Caldisericia bacterium]|nr:hypothetical protein [Caldisericia bacterium]